VEVPLFVFLHENAELFVRPAHLDRGVPHAIGVIIVQRVKDIDVDVLVILLPIVLRIVVQDVRGRAVIQALGKRLHYQPFRLAQVLCRVRVHIRVMPKKPPVHIKQYSVILGI
jgi:hypothetical protein